MTGAPSAAVHAPLHRERLWPSAGVWLGCCLVAAALGLTVLAVTSAAVAAAVSLAAVLITAAALAWTSAVVEVRDGQLRAGRARVPVSALGRVRVLDRTRMEALRGVEADVRAYLCQRGWVPGGVVVEVVDPDDPVPYWLISSRKPERLAAALERANGEPRG
jgi:Protein of unknown function (DUF3093)